MISKAQFLVLAFTCFGVNAFSQEQSKNVDLDPVIITGSLSPRKVSKTGRNIQTIEGKVIKDLPISSIDELIRYIPGVEVQMRGPYGAQSDIVIRGGTFQQVLVLLDGVRLNDPNTGHFSSYIPIAPTEIERIEVLKGASSAIYGSDAVGGVINIITKAFAAKNAGKEVDISYGATIGEYDLFKQTAGVYLQKKTQAIAFGMNRIKTDGQPQRGARGYVDNRTYSLSYNSHLTQKWQLSLRAAYDTRDFGAQNFYTLFTSDTATEKVKTGWYQGRLGYSSGDHKLSLDMGYKHVRDQYAFNTTFPGNDNKSKLFQTTITDVITLNDKNSLIAGVQYVHKKIRSNDRGSHDLPHYGAFLTSNHFLTKNFTISPSLRVDYSARIRTEFIPQLNASYTIDKVQLRGSIGKTIRDADFTERFYNYKKTLVTGGSVGNPDLTAEKSLSFELGADYFAATGLRISTSYFQRDQDDLIDWVKTPYANMPRKSNLSPTGTFGLASNFASVQTKGIELDIQFNKSFSDKFSIYTGIGALWLDSKSAGQQVVSYYLSSHAKYLVNFFTDFKISGLSLAINGVFKERKTATNTAINTTISKQYFVWNAKASYGLFKNIVQIFVEVDNIGNKTYSDLLGSKMPSRWFSGGINLQLAKKKS